MPPKPKFFGRIKEGKLYFDNRESFDKYLFTLDGDVEIVVKKRTKTRSLNQNAYLWAGVYPPISDHTGHSPEELHEIYKQMFLPKKFVNYGGATVEIHPSSTNLTTGEFTTFIERVRAEAATMGVSVPDPDGFVF